MSAILYINSVISEEKGFLSLIERERTAYEDYQDRSVLNGDVERLKTKLKNQFAKNKKVENKQIFGFGMRYYLLENYAYSNLHKDSTRDFTVNRRFSTSTYKTDAYAVLKVEINGKETEINSILQKIELPAGNYDIKIHLSLTYSDTTSIFEYTNNFIKKISNTVTLNCSLKDGYNFLKISEYVDFDLACFKSNITHSREVIVYALALPTNNHRLTATLMTFDDFNKSLLAESNTQFSIFYPANCYYKNGFLDEGGVIWSEEERQAEMQKARDDTKHLKSQSGYAYSSKDSREQKTTTQTTSFSQQNTTGQNHEKSIPSTSETTLLKSDEPKIKQTSIAWQFLTADGDFDKSYEEDYKIIVGKKKTDKKFEFFRFSRYGLNNANVSIDGLNCSAKDVIIPDGVNAISSFAFTSAKLENITIPSSVYSVGTNAFAGNNLLKKVTLIGNAFFSSKDSGITICEGAFKDCQNLTEFIKGYRRIEKIEANAFVNTGLKEVYIDPETEVDDDAFDDNCAYLRGSLSDDKNILLENYIKERIKIGKGFKKSTNTIVGNEKTLDEVDEKHDKTHDNKGNKTIENPQKSTYSPTSTKTIILSKQKPTEVKSTTKPTKTDAPQVSKATLEIPREQTEFEENFFKNCDSIEIKFHCTNPILPQNALENNKYLRRVFFYSTISEIPKKCFSSSQITNVEIRRGEELSLIGEYAFYGCKNLTEFSVKSTKRLTISEQAFAYCQNLSKVYIEAKDIVLENCCFSSCKSLKEITLVGENITVKNSIFDVGLEKFNLKCKTAYLQSAFRKCLNLTSASFDCDKITLLYGFCDCKNLKSVNLSCNELTFSEFAFKNCQNLEEVVCNCIEFDFASPSFSQCKKLTSVKFTDKTAFGKCNFKTVGENPKLKTVICSYDKEVIKNAQVKATGKKPLFFPVKIEKV